MVGRVSLEKAQEEMGRGVIPLSFLLETIAVDGALNGIAFESLDETQRKSVTAAFEDAYRVLLFNAKKDISEGSLTIRERVSLAPANELPGIRAWCDTNDDLLKDFRQVCPDGRLVVRMDDARDWLGALGIPCPSWLLCPGAGVPSKKTFSSVTEDSPCPAKEAASTGDWKQEARKIGAELAVAKPRLSILQIASQVSDELKKRGIKGRGGRVPSPDTIKRHALNGIKG